MNISSYKRYSQLVNKNINMFFKWLGIDTGFVLDEPEQWNNNNVYTAGANIVTHINIVNDIAGGVKLIKEHNNIIIKDLKQKQYFLQIVKDYKN